MNKSILDIQWLKSPMLHNSDGNNLTVAVLTTRENVSHSNIKRIIIILLLMSRISQEYPSCGPNVGNWKDNIQKFVTIFFVTI